MTDEELHRKSLDALEDMIAGATGWGCELQIYAIDELRDRLALPPWCARCMATGHKTYDHWRRICTKCGTAQESRDAAPFTVFVTPLDAPECEHTFSLREVDPAGDLQSADASS